MVESSSILYTLLAVLVIAYIVRWRSDKLAHIPVLGGPSAPLLSYIASYNWLRDGKNLISQGYERYHGSAFRIALLDQWLVVVSGSKMVDELRKRPSDELNFVEGLDEIMQSKYTIGRDPIVDGYHVDLIKDNLTRTLSSILPDVLDELTVAVQDYIPTKDNEWVSVNIMKTAQLIVARASNRVFVGLPLCRNSEWLDLAIRVTLEVIWNKNVINLFPSGLKGIAAACMGNVRRCYRQGIHHLKPLIDERTTMMREYGHDWPNKPNDLLQWVIEQAMLRNSGDEAIVQRIFIVNFAAIHTSSNSVTHALLDLAAYPEYIQPLREEVENALAEDGWTRTALGKMHKLDSLLKESQRVNGISLTSMTRKTLKDVILSDGTLLPKDTLVVAATYPIHQDDAYYPNANVFDPFRFARMREADGEGTKHQFVNTSVEFIAFGHGKHACPGRFFAANELKAMLAYILVNYDFKLPEDGRRPENLYIGEVVLPNPEGEIMFKRRQASLSSYM